MGDKQVTSLRDKDGERKYLNAKERQTVYEKSNALIEEQKYFCLVIYWTGARIMEALNLFPRHIDIADESIVLRSLKKRGVILDRAIPIPPFFLAELVTFLEGKKKDEPLWSFSRRTASRYVKKLMTLSDITGSKACSRGLRHSFAVNCVMNDVPLPTIKKWMGHKSLETTMIYTQIIGPEERRFAKRTWENIPHQ